MTGGVLTVKKLPLLLVLVMLVLTASGCIRTADATIRPGASIGLYETDAPERLGEPAVILHGGDEVQVLQKKGDWIQIQVDAGSGWIPKWYAEPSSESLQDASPEFRVAKSDISLNLNPGGPEIVMVNKGDLLKVIQFYQDWSLVQRQVFDIPAVQEGWILTSMLVSPEEFQPRQGFLPAGTTVTFDDGTEEITAYDMPVYIIEEEPTRILVGAAGGWSAWTSRDKLSCTLQP